MPFAMGADLGGTKLSAVLISEEGHPVHEIWMPHSFDSLEDLLAGFRTVTHECRDAAEAHGTSVGTLGVSLAAWMDPSRSHVILGANLGLQRVDIKQLLRVQLGFDDVVIENDGDATAWAEYRFGAGKDATSMALLSLGTGVGGGIIYEGRQLRGAKGLGGELGHICVDRQGPDCSCGASGCLEPLASGKSLDAAALRLRDSGASPWLAANRPTGYVTAKDLSLAAFSGDGAAIQAFDTAASAIAKAVAVLTPILDPEAVVVGGSVMAGAAELLLPQIRAHLAAINILGLVRTPPLVCQAKLGPLAAAIGAADAARYSASREPEDPS